MRESKERGPYKRWWLISSCPIVAESKPSNSSIMLHRRFPFWSSLLRKMRASPMLFDERERAQVTLNSIGDAVISTDVWARVTYLNTSR
jgi:hypothetical protein